MNGAKRGAGIASSGSHAQLTLEEASEDSIFLTPAKTGVLV